eukprot:Sdes_comp17672_c0_seq2m6944
MEKNALQNEQETLLKEIERKETQQKTRFESLANEFEKMKKDSEILQRDFDDFKENCCLEKNRWSQIDAENNLHFSELQKELESKKLEMEQQKQLKKNLRENLELRCNQLEKDCFQKLNQLNESELCRKSLEKTNSEVVSELENSQRMFRLTKENLQMCKELQIREAKL